MRRSFLTAAATLAVIVVAGVVAPAHGAASDDEPVAVTWYPGSGPAGVISVMGLDGSARHDVRTDVVDADRVAWSPDGSQLAFSRHTEGAVLIWTTDLSGHDLHQVTPITSDNFPDGNPAWSPDGKTIAYAHNGSVLNSGFVPDPNVSIWLVDADGRNVRQLTSSVTTSALHPAWDPRGGRVAFTGADSTSRWGIWVINADGTGTKALASPTDADYLEPAWSPDGSKIAFVAEPDPPLVRTDPSSPPPPFELGVMNSDGTSLHLITHSSPESPRLWAPAWTPDGHRIVFGSFRGDPNSARPGDDRLEVVDADGTNRRVLEADARSQDIVPAIAPAGVRFNTARPASDHAQPTSSTTAPATSRVQVEARPAAAAAQASVDSSDPPISAEPHTAPELSAPAAVTSETRRRASGRRNGPLDVAAILVLALTGTGLVRSLHSRLRRRLS